MLLSMRGFSRLGCAMAMVAVMQAVMVPANAQTVLTDRVLPILAASLAGDTDVPPPDTKTMIDEAEKQAAREHKKVL